MNTIKKTRESFEKKHVKDIKRLMKKQKTKGEKRPKKDIKI